MSQEQMSRGIEMIESAAEKLGEAKGTPLSEGMARGMPRSLNKRSKAVKAPCSLIDSMTSQSKR
jgi:hypothetical protein